MRMSGGRMVLSAKDVANAFSDAEVLEILRHLQLSSIHIETPGWRLLLSLAVNVEGSSYRARLAKSFAESGDIDRLAERMNDAMTLLITVMERLTPEDVGLLRANEREALVTSIFARFDETDWARWESITTVTLANEPYTALAAEEYGEDFTAYLAALRPIGPEELRASVNTSTFYSDLSDYLASICPAIAYEVRA